MSHRGKDLAERFRQALDASEEGVQRADSDREVRLQEGRAARQELFEDLSAFADTVGHLTAEPDEGRLTLQYKDAVLHLEAMGDGDRVRVRFHAADILKEEHRLYREALLKDRWVWTIRRPGRSEERVPLFDQGLEALLVRALGLPGVSEPTAERPLSPRLAAALIHPDTTTTPTPSAPQAAPHDAGDLPNLGEERKRTL